MHKTVVITCTKCKKETTQEVELSNSRINDFDIANFEIGCEDCGSHPSWECPKCFGNTDLIKEHILYREG